MFMLQRAEQWTTPNIFISQCWKSLKYREWGCGFFPPFEVTGYLTGWKGTKLSWLSDVVSTIALAHVGGLRSLESSFLLFSKTNDDKRYHLYKLPSSSHSLQEPLVHQLVSVVGVERGSELGRGGRFSFPPPLAPHYWLCTARHSCWECKREVTKL